MEIHEHIEQLVCELDEDEKVILNFHLIYY